ncbi:uncharacterized protein EKO05_0004007 [Ascochyta rabiei]|uniref:uncharacterized protein n=1 Tax=Didymella rabiei TaxID=5454 RepID=UPI0019020CAF|nr:uncharacterized protein EKO05_0004007 [Ascochyta rabiei]UPX13501.1 hypothetical protein EKO05_0004007 [Ascochyta rabiei]
MDILRWPPVIRLATLSLLLSPASAQNDTTTFDGTNKTQLDLGRCPWLIEGELSPNASVNSTGSVNLHWNALMMDPSQNDWTFTLTYNETRTQSAPTIHYLQSYVSAPESSDAKTCVTMFSGLNATSSSGGRNGCDGVLDETCTKALQKISYSERCTLPRPTEEILGRIREACGSDISNGGPVTTGTPQDFSNKTCSISHPPGSTSPDNFRTWSAMGQGIDLNHIDQNASDFTWYDLHVRQTVPFVISADFAGGVAETQVVCVAPREIVGRSRVPAEKSRACRRGPFSSWWTMGAAVFASWMLKVV